MERVKFKVEFVSAIERGRYVVVRKMIPGDFSVSHDATLGGYPVEAHLEQPRKIKPDGTQDKEVFAFTLRDANDVERFKVGQVVELG